MSHDGFDPGIPGPLGDDSDEERGSPLRLVKRLLLGSVGVFLALGLAAVLAVATFNFAVMPVLVRHGKQVKVPDVSGMPLEEAARVLAEHELAVRDTLGRPSASIPAGLIMDQDPWPGREVKPERRVRLIVSSGGRERVVPDLTGQTLRFARLTLGQEGYEMGDVVRVSTSRYPPDFVMASDPPESTVLAPGQPVSMLVSAGVSATEFVLPDLRGRRLTRVEDDLRYAGFEVEIVGDRFFDSLRRLEVVDTQPPPGARVKRGDRIVLIGG
jgi:serine/threonine-protein kinase